MPAASVLIILLLFGPGHYQDSGSKKLRVSIAQPVNNDIYLLKEITNSADTDIVVWPEAVSWYNNNSYCGETDWALNIANDTTGLTCGGSTRWTANTTIYGLYLLDGNSLFSSISSSTYPSSVSTGDNDTYTKPVSYTHLRAHATREDRG